MKATFIVVLLSILSSSCEVEGDLTRSELRNTSVAPNAELKFIGNFSPESGINVTGGVKIYQSNNLFQLQLDNFTISGGPDLKVYLSQSSTPTEFVNLGNLNPTVIYNIPPQVNLNVYKYVLIHCQQYNHLFAVALLTEI